MVLLGASNLHKSEKPTDFLACVCRHITESGNIPNKCVHSSQLRQMLCATTPSEGLIMKWDNFIFWHLKSESGVIAVCAPGGTSIHGDKIWQPSLASRRLLEEHLWLGGQKCKEGRKGSKHPCQLLQRVHILICCMLQKCTTFPKTTHNSIGWLLCYHTVRKSRNIWGQKRSPIFWYVVLIM